MVTIKLKQLAERLGKSILEMARETGLNRNTMTALYHQKVDAIHLETLERICQTYNVSLSDLIERQTPVVATNVRATDVQQWYRQEGEAIPFTCWPWIQAVNALDPRFFKRTFGVFVGYYRKNYVYAYWSGTHMEAMAQEVIDRYKQVERLEPLQREFRSVCQSIERMYHDVGADGAPAMPMPDPLKVLHEIIELYRPFWSLSLFIDAFDSGADQQLVAAATKSLRLTPDGAELLTAPPRPPFSSTMRQELLKIVIRLPNRAWTKKGLERLVKTNTRLKGLRATYDCLESNYAHVQHLTPERLAREIRKILARPDRGAAERRSWRRAESKRRTGMTAALRRINRQKNPLALIGELTSLREERKFYNLMGIHIMHRVLDVLEQQTGIPVRYLRCLMPHEAEAVVRGSLTVESLKVRYEQGTLVIVEGSQYKLVVGAEAAAMLREYQDRYAGSHQEQSMLTGQVASQGYAQGRAKIVMTRHDFGKFRDGDVLVAGMTRPEFVPLMKRATAIVTNEGGITCHAAIISRELGKPCIIGTKNATEVIHDGDLVEVRAHHGTVRILQRA